MTPPADSFQSSCYNNLLVARFRKAKEDKIYSALALIKGGLLAVNKSDSRDVMDMVDKLQQGL